MDQVKGSYNLRDHRDRKEKRYPGIQENRTAAREGGHIAGNARKALEAKTGTPVVSSENFLNPPPKRFSETAAKAFIKTRAKALAHDSKDLPKTRQRVKGKIHKVIEEVDGTITETLYGSEKIAKRLKPERKLEGGK